MNSKNLKTGWIWLLFMLIFAAWTPAEEQETRSNQQASEAKPAVPFTISVATTRITKPLKPDGTVDYAAALNARMSEGVTPENNAGVLLMQAIGPEAVSEAHREAFFKALGISVPTRNKRLLLHYGEFVEEHLKPEQAKSEINIDRVPYWDQQTQSMKRPWSRKEFPLVAEWLDRNAEAIRLALAASKRPRLFFPIVVSDDEILLAASPPVSASDIRELARLFASRAMLTLHVDQIDEAIELQLACHRLAILAGQQSDLIDALGSYAINGIACEADNALVASRKLSRQQLREYREQIEVLPLLATMSEKYDLGERFIALDSICHVALNKLDPEQVGLPNKNLSDKLFVASIDWDPILKRFNEEYDDIAAALRMPTYEKRQAALAQWSERLDKVLLERPSKSKQFVLFARRILGFKPAQEDINRRAWRVMLPTMTPAVEIASKAEIRAYTRRDLTIVALALAEYQREHGNYPERLSDLSPKYLKTLPQDRFTDKPLVYRRQEAGFLLYSVGANRKDDNGVLDGLEADDVAIRVPIEPES
jgi:hypothetical protein